ncbi:unannotated protein [freshwater metagenome]|uniref:Unannotated protein n=1 Tax=freshwater metagenome TaxID=449393 RepID=A0A6J7P1G4_9ZZZZ|nr:DUF222 domain-containing protein [Actinomycetota bacterium]
MSLLQLHSNNSDGSESSDRVEFASRTEHSDSSEKISQLLSAQPGINVLAELVDIDPFTLNKSQRIDFLEALERQASWLNAIMQRALVAVAGNESESPENLWSGVDDAEREEVASALRLSGTTAQLRIDVARTLTNHLPQTCTALATGEISTAHATVIAKETYSAISEGLSTFAIQEIESRALAHAEFHTPGQVANKVRHEIAKLAPKNFEESVAIARDSRRVTCYNDVAGMATIVAILPAPDAKTVMSAIDAYVQREKNQSRLSQSSDSLIDNSDDSSSLQASNSTFSQSRDHTSLDNSEKIEDIRDGRSMDMRRADALAAIAAMALAAESNEVTPHRRPISINVTVDLPTLLGLAENPGELAGYGAIPASLARELAADGKWRRFITDPYSGALLDYGRESYQPPQELVDFLIARDRTCRFPGCRRAAWASDLDHAESWDEGGATSAENLGALCRRHHRMKTHGGWKLESFSDGSCEWTSPVGKKYHVPARPIGETQ